MEQSENVATQTYWQSKSTSLTDIRKVIGNSTYIQTAKQKEHQKVNKVDTKSAKIDYDCECDKSAYNPHLTAILKNKKLNDLTIGSFHKQVHVRMIAPPMLTCESQHEGSPISFKVPIVRRNLCSDPARNYQQHSIKKQVATESFSRHSHQVTSTKAPAATKSFSSYPSTLY